MNEVGLVTEVNNNTAYVLFKRTSMCERCGACGMLSNMSEITIDVKNTLNANIGDSVTLEFAASTSLKSALMAYMFPLIMLIVGVVIGYNINNWFGLNIVQDVSAAICGIAFTAIAYLIIRKLEPRMSKKLKNVYKMVDVQKGEENVK